MLFELNYSRVKNGFYKISGNKNLLNKFSFTNTVLVH